jgi:hypothetical protein
MLLILGNKINTFLTTELYDYIKKTYTSSNEVMDKNIAVI